MQFSTLPSFHPSSVQIFSSAPCSQKPSAYVRFEVFTALAVKNVVFWDVVLVGADVSEDSFFAACYSR
jgi:hypothetical protein